ncbi:MAG: serine--tRNA ligase, partial [Candidatus Omnitrophica bacterium]|nr:serine--tRNA ligase [Candidatus Omnitrophota bacterium]
MFDIKLIRDDKEAVQKGLAAKKASADLDAVLKHDQKRRDLLVELEELRGQKNAANDEISRLIKEKKDPKKKIASMKAIALKIDEIEPKVKKVQGKLHEALISIPNLPHGSVPVGGVENNREVRSWGEAKQFDFKPKTHIEIAERLDI